MTQLNIEMEAKRVQLLHELVPAATSIALLINPTSPAYSEAATESAQSAARILRVRLLALNASTGTLCPRYTTDASSRLLVDS